MRERELPCDGCGTVTRFEVPPCPDGHGTDCPELVCTDCGGAYLLATTILRPVRLRRTASRSHAA